MDAAENLTVAALFHNQNLWWSGGTPIQKMFENQCLERLLKQNFSKWKKSDHGSSHVRHALDPPLYSAVVKSKVYGTL